MVNLLLTLALSATALAAPVAEPQLFGSGSGLLGGLGSGSGLGSGLLGGGGSGLLGGLGSGSGLLGGGGLLGGSSGLGGGSSGGLLGGLLGGGSSGGGGLLGGLGGLPSTGNAATYPGSTTSDDFLQGGCKSVVFVFARASTEPGNIGATVGPAMKDKLSKALNGDFAMQGVGSPYTAGLIDNFKTGGSSKEAINYMGQLITQVANKCPNAKIVVGGYSQGTAVTARSVAALPANIRNRINAAILYGYTQNQQLNGGIPGMAQDRVKVICNQGDEVCHGTLSIKQPHLEYLPTVDGAVEWILTKVK